MNDSAKIMQIAAFAGRVVVVFLAFALVAGLIVMIRGGDGR